MNSKKINIIFILGSGHCGSTLLDLLLSSHSDIFGIGELANSKKMTSKCTCGKKVRKCNFWHNLLDKDTLNNMPVYKKKLSTLTNSGDYINPNVNKKINEDKYKKENIDLFEKILNKSNSKVIVDSTKNVHRVELLANNDRINATLVHLVRDGRGVLWSYKKKYNKTLPFIRKWVGENIKVELVKNRVNTKYIHTQYKELANNTKKKLEVLLKETGLKNEDLLSALGTKTYHQVGGNRLRFKKITKIKEDTEWKEQLDLGSRSMFNLLAGWMNIYYSTKNNT